MNKNLPDDPLARSQLRANQYQHVDGTFELTFGGAILLMAVGFFISSKIPSSDSFFSNNLLPFVPLAAFAGGVYLIDALVQRFKMRVTYRRTGFIAYQKPRPIPRSTRLVIWIGVPVLTVITLALLWVNRPPVQTLNQDYMPVMTLLSGLLFTGLWVILGWRISIPRFYLVAVVVFLVSAWLLLTGAGVKTSLAGLFGAMGLALCFTGSLTLRQYLRQNPAQPEAADEH